MKTKYDLIVAGGGFAGSAAALAAARQGLSVLLFDKNNCLGGAAVACLVNPFMPYWTKGETGRTYLSRGIFAEIVADMRAMGEEAMSAVNETFSEEYLKLLLNRKLLGAGVTLLFHSRLIDADVQAGCVRSVTVSNKSGKQTFEADVFIDATGDGDLSVLCGAPWHLGRAADHLCQPMTLCFRVGGVDIKAGARQLAEIQKLYKQYRAEGKIKNVREDVLIFTTTQPGVLHFNSTRIVKRDPTNAQDVTMAEIEAREQVFELMTFLRENFSAFKDSYLLSTAMEIGVRESRMIEGDYLLTQEDLLACTRFDDSIAVCNYDIDIHNPEGSGTSHHFFQPGEYYTIPYRCLTPRHTTNLLVAGRCISSTHEAQASYRIMPTCTCLGEAAGVAASLAAKGRCGVRDIDIRQLQAILLEKGAMI